MEISQKSEKDPKMQKMTTLTKSAVSRGGAGPTTIPGESQETLDPGKLTMDEAVDKNDNSSAKHVQHSVSCQNSNGQDVREPLETASEPAPPTDDMPQSDKASKFQTKLTVTLKTPGGRPEPRAPRRAPGPAPPRPPQPPRYGLRPEYAARFQTFPSPGFQPRLPLANGRLGDCLVSHYAGVRGPGSGLSGSLSRLPHLVPQNDLVLSPPNIPVEELDVLPDEESLPVPVAQPLLKPVKIPPAPPPRTSSCPKTIIPAPPVGVTALHHRAFRKGKPLQMQDSLEEAPERVIYNPLLLSQPIATSSPTISLKGGRFEVSTSTDNLYGSKFRKQSYNDESSLEDFSKQKSKLKDELGRTDVPRLNKSVSSPSFGSFRTLRRKQSEALANSVENIISQRIPEVMTLPEKPEKKISKTHAPQNMSVSSSSGLDSPTKSDRRKRGVSIQFKKKQPSDGVDHVRRKDSADCRRDSAIPAKGMKIKGKNEETDATTSERERTNSVSSRTSSVVAGSSRRKFSISSNRTYLNEEKIPWCGCWGNGCV